MMFWSHSQLKRGALLCCAALVAACGSNAPEPKVVEVLMISIDASNNCSLENKAIECGGVAAAIRAQYPTSKPRVDICVDKQSRYEAAAEVMKSVSDAGLTVGSFHCGAAPTTG
jgi:biopolymer transport protein ExbD